ncbi:MAG: hypothetical protein EOO52_13600 [Gammaproteobacteria bacterium]|nr:MAG: hypothetical protein EOO52_13600 [Gammaproteobacteria bacterium]
MKLSKYLGQIFEPLFFISVCASSIVLWCTSSQFRNFTKDLTGKTGRSSIVVLRIVSKRGSMSMPMLTPTFILIPQIVLALMGKAFMVVLLGGAIGLATLALIPCLFPTPSTIIND